LKSVRAKFPGMCSGGARLLACMHIALSGLREAEF
jgi:hypothetical protein